MTKRKDPGILHELPVEGVLRELGVDAEVGLSAAEVRRRRRRYGKNKIYDESRTSIVRYVGYCSFDLLLLLLLLTAVTAAVFNEAAVTAVVIPILALSIVLRTAAYITARRYLESCASSPSVMPSAVTLRDGASRRIDARLLVRGDIVRLRAGDIVPADCRLIESDGLSVFEQQITGADGSVKKDEMSSSMRSNTLYAGSLVGTGSCVAVIIHTGGDTLLVRTRGAIPAKPRPKAPAHAGTGTVSVSPMADFTRSKLSRLLDSYSRKWGALMALLAFVVTVIDLFGGRRALYEAFFLGLSLAASAMCEYYSAIGDIAAARGIFAIRKDYGVAMRGVRSMEILSDIDAIVIPADGVIVAGGVECQAFYFDGNVHDRTAEDTDRADDGDRYDPPEELLRYASMAARPADNAEDIVYSPASCAIGDYLTYIGFDTDRVFDEKTVPVLFGGVSTDAGISFDTRLVNTDDRFMSVSVGEASEIVSACSFVSAHGGQTALTDAVRTGIAGFISHHERRGAHAVAVARKRTPFHSADRLPFSQTDMVLVGIMLLYTPLAPGVTDSVAKCRRAGIRVIMTGAGTASARLADRAGIISGREDIITWQQFAAMDKTARGDAVKRARLLLGFDARRMASFISEIKASGEKVAYVSSPRGDIIGELAPLGAADACIALYDSGDVVKMHAGAISPPASSAIPAESGSGAISLSENSFLAAEGGFSAVTASAAYAKRVYRNIANIANYLLTSQAARIFAVLMTVITGIGTIEAGMVLLWGLIFDFFAVIVLACERPDEGSLSDRNDVYERLSHPLSRLGTTSCFGLLWAGSIMLSARLYAGADDMRASIIFVSVLISLVVVCGEHRSEYPAFSRHRRISLPPLLLAAAAASVIVAVTIVPGAAAMFSIKQPDAAALCLSVIPAAVMLLVYEAVRAVGRMIKNKQ